MHSLRDHLLKAGLVTKEQAARAEAEKSGKKKKRRPKKNGDQKQEMSSAVRSAQPLHRMIDLSDPQRLQLAQAIESHRVRGETKGEIAFNFTLRDGRIRKMFVSKEMQAGLEKGALAIVENGEVERHIIVSAEALPAITVVDRDAVRFHNLAEP
jgi:uncharacterized protein YaiL (DUF2058 family)